MATPEPQRRISKLVTLHRAINHFQTIDAEFPPQLMDLVIQIAVAPNSTMTSLGKRTNMGLPQISRHIERLGKRWNGKPGHELAYAEENPDNRRQKFVKLTPRGERFVQTLVDILDE